MKRFTLDIRHTGIQIKVTSEKDKILLQRFLKGLTSYEERWVPGKGKIRTPKSTYGVYNKVLDIFGIHRNLYTDFIEYLKDNHVRDEEISQYNHESHTGLENYLELKEGVNPINYQIPIIDFLLDKNPIKILPLQTGKGKSFLGLYTAYKTKKRTAILMSAGHLDTWLKDAEKFFVSTKKIKVIRGSPQLRKYIHEGLKGKLDVDIFLISINTLREFISEYEETGQSTYGCTPLEFYNVLGVHIRITDEVHENLHFNFRHDIQTDSPICIYMSATIESNIPFTNRLYQIIYPIDRRYRGLKWDAYTDVIALGYNLHDYRDAKYKGGNGMYSHHVYEEWICKNPKRLHHYMELIKNIVNVGFIKNYQKGMKILIIFSSVEVCAVMANFLQKTFPNFTASAYNNEHEIEVLHNTDIICSTIGSSGTGKNIEGLRTVILTVALSNREKNIQVLGRLRKLDKMYPGVTPTFYYLVAKDIPKHLQYHHSKLHLFTGLVKSHRVINVTNII